MDTITIKVKIKKSDSLAEHYRDQGLFFDAIANSLNIDTSQIEEIDDSNLESSIKFLRETWK